MGIQAPSVSFGWYLDRSNRIFGDATKVESPLNPEILKNAPKSQVAEVLSLFGKLFGHIPGSALSIDFWAYSWISTEYRFLGIFLDQH